MDSKDFISRDSENELSAQIFSEVADEIVICSDDLLLVAEAITQYCLLIETTGNDYREVLTSSAQDYMMLAGLYKARSRRFEGIMKRFTGDIKEDEVLAEKKVKITIRI